jgi:hypothetical protein
MSGTETVPKTILGGYRLHRTLFEKFTRKNKRLRSESGLVTLDL